MSSPRGTQDQKMSRMTRKGALEVASLTSSMDEDEEYGFRDPDQEVDSLPQPYRFINKMVTLILDRAWEMIEKRDALHEAQRSRLQPTTYGPQAESKLNSKPTCMAVSQEYMFIGGANGFSIYNLLSGKQLYVWEKLKVEVTSIWTVDLESEILLVLLDETGTVRLLYFCRDCLYLIKTINDTEEANKPTACVKMQLSVGGDFAAFLLQGKLGRSRKG